MVGNACRKKYAEGLHEVRCILDAFQIQKELYCVFSLFNRPYQSTNSQEQITLVKYVHSKLAAICHESGLKGISYIGGPFCYYCKDPTVLPLVQYPKMQKNCYYKRTIVEEDPQMVDKHIIRCGRCCKDCNVIELLILDMKCHPGL